jgi:predicted N-acetyltransferase YhbS
VTYVAIEDREVLGFVTIAPGHLEIEDLPAEARAGLPRYPLPILRLARLAVGRAVQGRGVGSELLKFVLRLATRMADEFGCVGVVVDAKSGAQRFYIRYGFVAINAVQGQSDARPQPLPMFLSMRKIKRAEAVA